MQGRAFQPGRTVVFLVPAPYWPRYRAEGWRLVDGLPDDPIVDVPTELETARRAATPAPTPEPAPSGPSPAPDAGEAERAQAPASPAPRTDEPADARPRKRGR